MANCLYHRHSFQAAVHAATLVSAVLIAAPALARPPHKRAMADYYGKFLDKKLNDCRTCHLPVKKGADESDRPHNVFGARVAAVRRELKKAGKKTDIAARLAAIADEDSDGDGVKNVIEILSGHFPGDAKDVPGKEKLTQGEKLLAAFVASRQGYQWRPFVKVERPPLPNVKNTAWVRNPVDAFITAGHEKHGLKPRPAAPKHVLLRRVYLDLIGLPPTPEEVRAYVNDPSPNAYEKVVDQLLENSHYGERWGRHWMDVWRYSDWYGYRAEVRNSQPHIWRWRDWIINAVNNDKSYDRMIQEMLAGDELAPGDPDVLPATGFLVRNWFKFNRNVWLDRAIEHTGKAFLGITINCARCHDHMYDPITQKEYYQFRAIFEPHKVRTDRVPGQPDVKKNGLVRVYDATLNPKTYLFERGEEKKPDKKNPLEPTVPEFLTWKSFAIEPVLLPADAVFPDKRAFVIDEDLAASNAKIKQKKAALTKAKNSKKSVELAELEYRLAEVEHAALQAVLAVEALDGRGESGTAKKKTATKANLAQRTADQLRAKVTVLNLRTTLAKTAKNKRAAIAKKLKAAEAALTKAEKAAQQPPSTKYTPRQIKRYPATSTGRRLALARWITDKNNPLTARVAMNHIWLRHFGKPLVPTVFDLGRNGKPPTHPALLDWLATEFMDQKWSMKAMHRLLVTSNAYRMRSTNDKVNVAIDVDNRYLWRMNSRRMEAEIVRDSVLAVAGQLDRTFGGPEIDENLGQTTRRRSIYYRYAPEKKMTFLELFDSPSVDECYRRAESIVPQQALALTNSTLVLTQSRLLARKLAKKLGEANAQTAADFVKVSFEHILCRQPSMKEQTMCEQFLAGQVKLLQNQKVLTAFGGGSKNSIPPSRDPHLRARESLIHVLLNHNEFLTIR